MGVIYLLFKDPIAFFVLVVPLLYSIIFHEVAHGFVALLFGDNTARASGRLTLNPASHIDPVGALALFFIGFGWAKPVPVDYRKFRNFRTGLISVSLAGCFTNIIIAAIALFILKSMEGTGNVYFVRILVVLVKINIILGAFNLIPIPPLDGSKVLMGFLPAKGQAMFSKLEPYGFPIIIILLFTGLLTPLIIFIHNVLLDVIRLIVGV